MQINLAIPHYNAPAALRNLLAQSVTQNFDSVTVLDDHSADIEAVQTIASEFPTVSFIFGESNLGAGGNRNRFLQLGRTGIVWFLDCDMRIETLNVPEILRRKFTGDNHIMLGGTILYPNGMPMAWNYGHEMHPRRDQEFMRATGSNGRQTLCQNGWDYPWIWGEKVTNDRQVDWVAEGSFALRVDDFQRIGGYDTEFRYHEGQDLAHRLREANVKIFATSSIVCTHLDIEVRGKSRQREIEQSARLFYKKHHIKL